PAGGASGCAARSRRSAWRLPGRRCGGRARRRSPWASCSTCVRRPSLERLDRVVLVGVDAQVAGDLERALDDVARRELRLLQQGARRSGRKRSAGADRDDAVLGLEDVAVAADDEGGLVVGDGEHRLESAQDAVGAPVLRQLDGRADEMALVLFELGLEALEQRERVGGRTREAGEYLVVVEA